MSVSVTRRSKDYRGDSNFNALFTPLTFLVTYFNSGVNPLLYAFLSRNFRNGIQEVFQCVFKRKKKNGSSSFQRATIPVSLAIIKAPHCPVISCTLKWM